MCLCGWDVGVVVMMGVAKFVWVWKFWAYHKKCLVTSISFWLRGPWKKLSFKGVKKFYFIIFYFPFCISYLSWISAAAYTFYYHQIARHESLVLLCKTTLNLCNSFSFNQQRWQHTTSCSNRTSFNMGQVLVKSDQCIVNLRLLNHSYILMHIQ